MPMWKLRWEDIMRRNKLRWEEMWNEKFVFRAGEDDVDEQREEAVWRLLAAKGAVSWAIQEQE